MNFGHYPLEAERVVAAEPEPHLTLQYFDGCPNWQLARDRLREALRSTSGDDGAVTYEKIETPEQAEQRRFRGSPTILVDGRDPFADEEAPVGLSCRLFQTEAGVEGAPSVAQLANVLGA